MNLDRFMLFKNEVQLKVLIRVKKTMKGDNGDMYMTFVHDVVDLMAMMTAELMFRGHVR